MSRTTSYKTEIVIPQPQLQSHAGNIKGTPCMEIMQLAINKIAKEHGGSATQSYRDCNGKDHPCLLGLSTPALPNGLGIDVDDSGRVRFKYDRQGANVGEVQAICRDLARAYAVIAVMRAKRKRGYGVSIEAETANLRGRSVTTVGIMG